MPDEMKAVLMDRYGGPEVLRWGTAAMPVPKAGQVRIRVRAASVNPIDWKTRKGMLRLIRPLARPAVLGYDVAGDIDALGPGVDDAFAIGEAVFARLESPGAYAEYAIAGVRAVAPKPATLDYGQAAAIPLAGLTSLQALRDLGHVGDGEHHVLVNGASGGVGTFAVQIAKALGATVTAVCSAANHSLVAGLGADRLIDYRTTDFAREPVRYSVVLDAAATRTYWQVRPVLADRGVYVTTLPSAGILFWTAVTAIVRHQRAHFVMMKPSGADLRYLGELAATGRLSPVLDSVFPLEKTAEAQTRSETGKARGKIVLNVGNSAILEVPGIGQNSRLGGNSGA